MQNVSKDSVMRVVCEADHPVGAIYVGKVLGIPQTTIGRILLKLEKDDYLVKVSNRGRILSEKGKKYIREKKEQEGKKIQTDRIYDIVENTSIKSMLDILQIRRLLEPKAAVDCCVNASNDQMKELEQRLIRYSDARAAGFTGNDEDIEIHLNIAKASGNSMLYQIMEVILSDVNGHMKMTSAETEYPHVILEVGKAILKRDKEAARIAMETHVDDMIEYLENNYSDLSDNTISE